MKLYDTLIESVDDLEPSVKGIYSCVLIGGLDTRPRDKSISWQVEQLKNATGFKNVKGFRWSVDGTTLKDFFNQNPKIPVFMFSKGCEKVYEVLKCDVSVNRIYLIEPWCGSSSSMNFFNNVATKIPPYHIFVGRDTGTGYGIRGAVSSESKSHWDSIASVGRMFGGTMNEQIIDKIMNKVKSFMGVSNSYKPFSIDNLKAEIVRQGIKQPNIVLAQATWESGHFKSDIFKENHNLFGMKQPKVRKTLATGENRGHATFNNWVDSVKDYKIFQDENGYSGLSYDQYMKKLDTDYCPGCNYSKNITSMIKYNKKNNIFI